MEKSPKPKEVELLFEVDGIELTAYRTEDGRTNARVVKYEDVMYWGMHHVEYTWDNGVVSIIFDSESEQEDMLAYGWTPEVSLKPPAPEIVEAYIIHQASYIETDIRDFQSSM